MKVNVNYPLPTIHPNGTPKDMLLKGYMKVHYALNKLSDALADCEFHRCDYPISQQVCGVDSLKAKGEAGDEITIAHIGDTDSFADQERRFQLRRSAPSVIGVDLKDLYSNVKDIPINLTQGQDFLKGAGRGSDILVLHRIPDERTSESLQLGFETYDSEAQKSALVSEEGHTIDNWKRAISESDADLVYIFYLFRSGDFTGLDLGDVDGYKLVGDLLDQGKEGDHVQTVLQKTNDTAFQQARKERMKHIKNLGAFKQYNLEHVMHLRSF